MSHDGLPTGEGTAGKNDVADPHPATEAHYDKVPHPGGTKPPRNSDVALNSYNNNGVRPQPHNKGADQMTSVKLDEDLLDGIENFIADRDAPPNVKMSYDDAVNVMVRDWLMGQGYMPLPNDPDEIVQALDAAEVPRT